MDAILRGLRRVFTGREVVLAREWQTRARERTEQGSLEDSRRFEEVFRCSEGSDRILLGRARDTTGLPYWAGLSAEDLLGQHVWITGSTGSGKSYAVLAWLLQLLPQEDLSVVLVDHKGESARDTTEVLLPALAARSGAQGGLFRSIRQVRPFDPEHVPLLRLTAPEQGVAREIQAESLAASLADAQGVDLGIRMDRIFAKLSSLAIELNEPLTVLSTWLSVPGAAARAAVRSKDPSLRQYVLGEYQSENRSSVQALSARLDTFLGLPQTRLALSTPSCLSFADCLESGVTIVDLGDPPSGAERVAKFWGRVLLGRLTRAVLSRKVTATSPHCLIVLEEFQEALGSGSAEQLARLLALSRSRKVSLWFVNQQPAQVAAVDPSLVKLLRTNTGLELILRCNAEDAKAVAHAFPVPVGECKPAEYRQDLAFELTRLPQRDGYLWAKRLGLRAERVRTPRLDMEGLRVLAESAPHEVVDAIRRGCVSVPRAELEAQLRADRSRTAPRPAPFTQERETPPVDDTPFPRLG